MVNSLANHGFLPRSGCNVSLEQILAGFDEAIHLARDSTLAPATLSLTTSTTGNPQTVNLDDMNKHGVIEHDGSLSRNDIYFGDNHSFNVTIWNSVAAFFTKPTISIATAGKARRARLAAAAAVNPKFNITGQEQFSLFETALYLRVFGNLTFGDAKTQWVNVLFRKSLEQQCRH